MHRSHPIPRAAHTARISSPLKPMNRSSLSTNKVTIVPTPCSRKESISATRSRCVRPCRQGPCIPGGCEAIHIKSNGAAMLAIVIGVEPATTPMALCFTSAWPMLKTRSTLAHYSRTNRTHLFGYKQGWRRAREHTHTQQGQQATTVKIHSHTH